MSSVKKIAIVGGGVAGLQAARAIKRAGMVPIIFERANEIGGVWRSNYDGYSVQVPRVLYEFPGFPAKYGDFASGPEVQKYIQSFASSNGLTDPSVLRLGTTVKKLQQVGSKWAVESSTGTKEQFDYVVMATGLYGSPFMPSFPGQTTFKGKILHSTQFTDAASQAKGKRVAVVGAGKSALDCVLAAQHSGATASELVYRQAHWGTPQYIAGLIPFQYVFLSRFGQALVSCYKGAWPTAPGSVHMAHKVLRPIMGPIFGIVEALFAVQLGHKGEFQPPNDVVADFYSVAAVVDSQFKRRVAKGDIKAKRGEIASLDESGVVLKDGSHINADLLVLATGFRREYASLFDNSVLEKLKIENDGLWLYRSIVPVDVENLAFVGSETATISNIGTAAIQSEWLVKMLKGEMKLPSKAEMEAEVEVHKKFSREWMPETTARAALVLLHQTHYHDQLCKDMKVAHRRKGLNVVAELFAPYTPADYASLVR